jgi:hypothetical protein
MPMETDMRCSGKTGRSCSRPKHCLPSARCPDASGRRGAFLAGTCLKRNPAGQEKRPLSPAARSLGRKRPRRAATWRRQSPCCRLEIRCIAQFFNPKPEPSKRLAARVERVRSQTLLRDCNKLAAATARKHAKQTYVICADRNAASQHGEAERDPPRPDEAEAHKSVLPARRVCARGPRHWELPRWMVVESLTCRIDLPKE